MHRKVNKMEALIGSGTGKYQLAYILNLLVIIHFRISFNPSLCYSFHMIVSTRSTIFEPELKSHT